jgi:hypothetical protein
MSFPQLSCAGPDTQKCTCLNPAAIAHIALFAAPSRALAIDPRKSLDRVIALAAHESRKSGIRNCEIRLSRARRGPGAVRVSSDVGFRLLASHLHADNGDFE